MSEPLIIPYIVAEAPLGGIFSKWALHRAVDVGVCGDLVLINGLVSKNIHVVREACLIASEKKSVSAVPLLIKLLNISDKETSALAQLAIKDIIGENKLSAAGSEQGREYIHSLIRDAQIKGFTGRIASEKLTSYGILAVEQISDSLERIVNGKKHGDEILPLMDALGNIGSGYRPELIVTFLQKTLTQALRESTQVALARLGTASLPFLDKELRSSDYCRFSSAVEVLYAVDKELAVFYLSKLLVSGYNLSEAMRLKTYEIFGRAGMVEAQEALRQGVQFEDSPFIQIQAIQALGKIKNESVVPILLKAMIQDPDHTVREAASRALYINGTPRAHMALTESYLSDSVSSSTSAEIGKILKEKAIQSGSGR
jgi:HEAT repeat protein